MPASGPVYQPTTVSYEQQSEWSRPGSYLSQTVSGGMRGPRCVQWVLLALGIFSLCAGKPFTISTGSTHIYQIYINELNYDMWCIK